VALGSRSKHDPASELLRIHLLRLSEKGYKQHSGGEFGWCRAGEIGQIPLSGGPESYVAGFSKAFRTVSLSWTLAIFERKG
jgi:hypothetical protein